MLLLVGTWSYMNSHWVTVTAYPVTHIQWGHDSNWLAAWKHSLCTAQPLYKTWRWNLMCSNLYNQRMQVPRLKWLKLWVRWRMWGNNLNKPGLSYVYQSIKLLMGHTIEMLTCWTHSLPYWLYIRSVVICCCTHLDLMILQTYFGVILFFIAWGKTTSNISVKTTVNTRGQ